MRCTGKIYSWLPWADHDSDEKYELDEIMAETLGQKLLEDVEARLDKLRKLYENCD